ncbi:MAG: SRPBCC domain-containing protein [Chitinophagaceae bacterium]|nr:SRPBCC domain-containing protein [Chitinophagaceae bacterium]
MKKKLIQKSISIDAPAEVVWNVLQEDSLTRQWYAEFSPGTYAETDWKVGSKAIFVDHTKNGLISKVVESDPHRKLALEYTGVVTDGKEDYEGELASGMKGGMESYYLTEANGGTALQVTCDMGEEMYESMSQAWDKAMDKIKALSEQ